jgi:hypothetical protein
MGWNLGSWLAPRQSSAKSAFGDRRAIVEAMEPRRLLSGTVHATTKFTDGNFSPINWSVLTVTGGTGGTQTAVRAAKGGHPGAYRVLTNTVFTQSGGVGSIIYGFNEYGFPFVF